ncbi:RpiB/LacA/LacB family sugar-phosphate isomerase [Virgisporangium ochraceum]|uniref:Ribose 5-phosphate isomerase B n=1 Tax=Virgisporangium ochraceum TaxID=65505 RepID=A0A8J3ZQ53_9ACTN|nr:RpiB/LacA/LacB family sugar-phosphate isomerase [Virgisporangium ochraceum]GIJ68132.1 ribose 5-phosphate isomerase B [Virgisporangium ochraceum]
MRIAFAADDENDTTRAVLDLLARRGDEVVRVPADAGAPAGAGDSVDAGAGAAAAPGGSGAAAAGSGAAGAVAWPDLGAGVGRAVVEGAADVGIVMCWTGTGTAIAANKVPGVRAALAWDPWIARGARLWNDANVLAMSLKRLAPDVAVEVTEAFLAVEEADPEEGENIAALDRLLPP